MEQLIINSTDKEDVYKEILPQIEAITSDETDMIANMANIAAVLKEAFGFFWVGFYIVKDIDSQLDEFRESAARESIKRGSDDGKELVLGPFQGPLACTRIKYGRGVCGTAWKENRTVVVPDVEQFPGHIACSSLSRSEIVVPVYSNARNNDNGVSEKVGNCIAVLDIDSKELNTFDSIDALYLQQIVALL